MDKPIVRVRKAYEQIADQLRELILSGDLTPGQRLPNEAGLATQFGVSRPTVREALRVLAAEGLVITAKGASGGTYIAKPSVAQITDYLASSMTVLSRAAEITLDEFLEARLLIEAPASRLATERHDEEAIKQMELAIPDDPIALGVDEQFVFNKDFHLALVAASGNSLLTICSAPVFRVLQADLKRADLNREYHERVNRDHRAILDRIREGDADAAEAEVRAHLDYLRPKYQQAWRGATGGHPHSH